MVTLTLDQLILFHEKIVAKTGGSAGVRDSGLIESALRKAEATFGGQDLYETDIRKIAVIAYSLIKNHGFVDGNKRIGVSAMLLLLKMNMISISYTQQELVELGLRVADGTYNEADIENWISTHIV
jgi:death-on-curing protein